MSTPDDSDRSLIIAHRQGDDGAFSLLVKKYIDRVYAYALLNTKDPHVAEDITQLTFVNAWKALPRFNIERPFLPWIFTIAHNALVDTQRKRRTLAFSDFDNADGNYLVDTLEDPEPLPDELFEKKELAAMLTSALAKLPLAQQEVLHLYYQVGLTLEEVAQSLGRPTDTVKSQHRRALITLRKHPTDEERK